MEPVGQLGPIGSEIAPDSCLFKALTINITCGLWQVKAVCNVIGVALTDLYFYLSAIVDLFIVGMQSNSSFEVLLGATPYGHDKYHVNTVLKF